MKLFIVKAQVMYFFLFLVYLEEFEIDLFCGN